MRELLEGVNLTTFAAGNRRILSRISYRPTWPHAGYTAGGIYLFWPTIHHWLPGALAGSATLWSIAALIAGQAQPATEAATDGDNPADQTPAATLPTPADAHRAVAILGAAGTHVALTAVTAHLAAAHPLWKRSGKATRALLQEARVEVRAGVKVEGISVPGIHHDDVPPLPPTPGPTPDGVVVAGQNNNNNHNNADTDPTQKGFTSIPDPDQPNRTMIIHAA